MAARRQSSMLASKRIQSQLSSLEPSPSTERKAPTTESSPRRSVKRVSRSNSTGDASDGSDDTLESHHRPTKRLKKEKSTRKSESASILHQRLFSTSDSGPDAAVLLFPCSLPLRHHATEYHRPLLLHGESGRRGRSALLAWYDGVNTNRSMPWRKPFVDPEDYSHHTDAQVLREALTQRAYEVFISEIMLQQTRVKTVIDYWNRWMAKWPTIYDLAKANEEDVMSAWRGLGYYSRCRRILEACKKIVDHPEWQGLMPQDAKVLETQIPGVGPYTAGALSSIVFGRPAAMVDGNVLRVLSRQLGLLADTKTNKTIIELIWACAQSLVATVAIEVASERNQQGEAQPNDGPGRWGQALMELGSTICTPSPNCADCPVTGTCRAYQEGRALGAARGLCSSLPRSPYGAVDIEDACQLCEPVQDTVAEEPLEVVPAKKSKQSTLASFFSTKSTKTPKKRAEEDVEARISTEALKVIVGHAQRFPVKVVKKALREQETLVCAVRRAKDGHYLLQKRPEKGEEITRLFHRDRFS